MSAVETRIREVFQDAGATGWVHAVPLAGPPARHFARIGLVPDGGAMAFVCARAGAGRAARMAMLSERVSAHTAFGWGLVDEVVPDGELAPAVGARLDALAAGPTAAYAGVKRQLNAWLYSGLGEQLELEADIQQEMAATGDFAEGLAAFAAKRDPGFRGA